MNLFAYILGYFTHYTYFSLLIFIFCLIFFRKKIFLNIITFIAAILITQIHEANIKPQRNVFNQVILKSFESKVISFPKQKERLTQYHVSYEKQMIELFCLKNCPALYPGEIWQWQGKIKPIENYHNFYDRTLWHEPHHRHILGRVFVDGKSLQRIAAIAPHDWINQIRKKLFDAVYFYIPEKDQHFSRALFLTLILGLGDELDNTEWALFKNTGIVHLMVVSGAHFNLLLVLVMRIFGLFYQVFPMLALWFPRQGFVASIALILGFIYAAISGLGIPIQRAWLMSLVQFLPYFGFSKYAIWHGMRFSVYVILAIEPHAIYYPGAYLSYLAVISLIMAAEMTKTLKKMKLLLNQFTCHLLMMPLCFLWFGQFPLLALLVNLFAIPWVSYVFLPIIFLNSVFFLFKQPPVMLGFFKLNSEIFEKTLEWLQHFPMTQLHFWHLSAVDAFACVAALLILFLLPLWRFRGVAILILGLSLSGEQGVLKQNEFQADVLDVGQGLAILLHTKHHHLLYDLGPRHAAYQALSPYLMALKYLKLDGMVLSHHDADHMGGLGIILEKYPHLPMIVDNLSSYQHVKQKIINCHATPDWYWDGVRFSFLKYARQHASKNNHSCVLKISNRQFSLLLPGDIEASAEKRLLKIYGSKLRSDALVLAHHGSHSSSTLDFIKAIKPQLGLISYGRFNAYGHPHQDILERFKSLHIPLVSTGKEGMIRLFFFEHHWFYQTYQSLFMFNYNAFRVIIEKWLLLQI